MTTASLSHAGVATATTAALLAVLLVGEVAQTPVMAAALAAGAIAGWGPKAWTWRTGLAFVAGIVPALAVLLGGMRSLAGIALLVSAAGLVPAATIALGVLADLYQTRPESRVCPLCLGLRTLVVAWAAMTLGQIVDLVARGTLAAGAGTFSTQVGMFALDLVLTATVLAVLPAVIAAGVRDLFERAGESMP